MRKFLTWLAGFLLVSSLLAPGILLCVELMEINSQQLIIGLLSYYVIAFPIGVMLVPGDEENHKEESLHANVEVDVFYGENEAIEKSFGMQNIKESELRNFTRDLPLNNVTDITVKIKVK